MKKNENRDKQIEEMAQDLENHTCMSQFQAEIASRMLYNIGYRKIYDDYQRQCTCYALGCQMAEELKKKVACEIFEEIEKILLDLKYTAESRYTHVAIETLEEVGNWLLHECVPKRLAELKKKYTEEE